MCDHLPTLNAGVQIPVNRPFSRLFMMQNGETTLNLQQTRNFFVVSFEISYPFPRFFGRTWYHMGDAKYPRAYYKHIWCWNIKIQKHNEAGLKNTMLIKKECISQHTRLPYKAIIRAIVWSCFSNLHAKHQLCCFSSLDSQVWSGSCNVAEVLNSIIFLDSQACSGLYDVPELWSSIIFLDYDSYDVAELPNLIMLLVFVIMLRHVWCNCQI